MVTLLRSDRAQTSLTVNAPPGWDPDLNGCGWSLEKDEAAAIKATSITLPANPLAMLSHPREVAALIEQAAAKAK